MFTSTFIGKYLAVIIEIMKRELFILFNSVFLSITAFAGLTSPFRSTVSGVSIPNTHIVAKAQGEILRGMAPLTLAQALELKSYGIKRILIFRNDVPGEAAIGNELKLLEKAGFRANQIQIVPFKWKDITDFNEPCEQTIFALKLLKEVIETKNDKIFFHCTVGEDRTGYLAGLFRILFEKISAKNAFQNEMCARGYAEGDPKKPKFVSQTVHENITPLFLEFNNLIAKRQLSFDNLNNQVCQHEPRKKVKPRLRCQPEKLP